MSAEMKASVLLTLKDDLTGKAKQAAKGLHDLAGAAKGIGSGGRAGLGKMAGEAGQLGTAAEKAAASLNHIGAAKVANSGLAAATKEANALAAAAEKAAAATQKAAVAPRMHPSFRAVTPWESKQADRHQRMLEDASARRDIKKQLAAEEGGAGGLFFGFGSKLMNVWAGLQLAGMAAHAVDAVISRVGDVQAMREKIKWATGGDQGAADAAYRKAFELSGKYRNTTVLENLHIIDDLRANLPEAFDKVLEEAADPFVRMHSFFKAWEGGKHSGKAEAALKDIGAAIRAGELTGISSAEDLVKHTQALATAKILFGEKFKVQEYFQATQKAATALSAADDTFKYIDFPILLQRLSQGAGVALRTGFTKFVAGGTVSQQTAENWRALGLVDMDKVELDKKGKIKASSLLGTSWLKGGDEYGVNFSDAIMTKLVPALATKGGLAGLKGLKEAWQARDVEKVSHILSEFRKDKAAMVKLSQMAIGLAKDPSAAKLLEELIMGGGSVLRDRERALAINKNVEDFESYDNMKQELAAQADRVVQALTGRDFMKNVIAAGNAVSGWLSELATYFKANFNPDHPVAKGIIDYFGMGDDFNTWLKWKLGLIPDMVAPDKETAAEIGRFGALPGAAATPPPPAVDKGGFWDWFSGLFGGGATKTSGGFDLGRAVREKLARGIGVDLVDGFKGAAAGAAFGIGAAGFTPAAGAGAMMLDRYAQATTLAGGAVPATAGAEAAPSIMGAATAPITIQAQGPQVTFNQAPPVITISVTVNATTNAAPGEIGAAVAEYARAAVGRALHDGGQ